MTDMLMCCCTSLMTSTAVGRAAADRREQHSIAKGSPTLVMLRSLPHAAMLQHCFVFFPWCEHSSAGGGGGGGGRRGGHGIEGRR